jgi:hypothetical protein
MSKGAIMSLIGLGALSACAAPQVDGSTGATASAPLSMDGVAFVADIGLGPAGEMLTAAGAVPTSGRAIRVHRDDGVALTESDGRLAKQAAVEACDLAGGRFNAAALGRYDGSGAWIFNGSCA